MFSIVSFLVCMMFCLGGFYVCTRRYINIYVCTRMFGYTYLNSSLFCHERCTLLCIEGHTIEMSESLVSLAAWGFRVNVQTIPTGFKSYHLGLNRLIGLWMLICVGSPDFFHIEPLHVTVR